MKIALVFTISFICIGVSAQISHVPDDRIYDLYDSTYITRIQHNHPQMIQRWNYYLNHSYMITSLDGKKELLIKGVVHIEDKSTINILALERSGKVKRDMKKISIYKINNSSEFLALYPTQRCIEEIERLRRSNL